MRKRFILLSLAFLFTSSLVCVALGLGFKSYSLNIISSGDFDPVGSDGWLRNGAVLDFADLFERGNILELKIGTWRPAGALPAKVKVSVCDAPVSEFESKPGSVNLIPLKGECEPRRVKLTTDTPYTPPGEDDRSLITQISGTKITSRFGFALLSPLKILCVSAALFLTLSLVYCALGRFKIAGCVCLLAAALFLLSRAEPLDFAKLNVLWLFVSTLSLGWYLATYIYAGEKKIGPSLAGEPWSSKLDLFLPLGLVLLGALFRFYGLSFGLPDNYHPDEVPKVNSIMGMYQNGDLNPRYFLHPSFLLYCTYFVNWLFHLFGMQGDFRETAFLAGRSVSATAGSLSIYLLFLVGRRLFSRNAGLMAAALLAVLPLHITCSRYLKEDVLLIFFTLACLLAMLQSVDQRKIAYLYLAGFLVGLSASTKYSGVLNIVIVLFSPWYASGSWKPDKLFLRHAFFAALISPLGFFMASPYVILNSHKFLSDFRYEKKHMLKGHTSAIDSWSQYWMFHFSHSVMPGMTPLVALASVFALGALLYRQSPKEILLVLLILFFYLPSEWVKAKPFPQPDRYILPALPFLALLLSQFLAELRLSKVKRLRPVLYLLVLITPLWRSLALARDINHDTRVQAKEWMASNLARGSSLLLDWQPYAPYLRGTDFKVDYVLREGIARKLNRDYLLKSGKDYLVLSSLFYGRYFDTSVSDPLIRRRFLGVFRHMPVLKEFSAPSKTYGFHNPVLTIFSLRASDFAKLSEETRLKADGKLSETSNEIRSSFRWPKP